MNVSMSASGILGIGPTDSGSCSGFVGSTGAKKKSSEGFHILYGVEAGQLTPTTLREPLEELHDVAQAVSGYF
jgi:hypothetical protein